MTADATTSRVNHFVSAGTTYQGACSQSSLTNGGGTVFPNLVTLTFSTASDDYCPRILDTVSAIIDLKVYQDYTRSTEQTQAGLLKGKYAYMSPEQTRGDKLDARSDVFAAGILLWELVTWRRLFKRSTDLATLVAVSDEPAPPMSMINPESPPELDQVVLKALAVEPEA